TSTPFPYTTLFRSHRQGQNRGGDECCQLLLHVTSSIGCNPCPLVGDVLEGQSQVTAVHAARGSIGLRAPPSDSSLRGTRAIMLTLLGSHFHGGCVRHDLLPRYSVTFLIKNN